MKPEAAGTAVHDSRGFTLVEIMIVVAIIGLLAAIAIPSFLKARQLSQATAIARELTVFRDGLVMYAMEHPAYPADAAAGVCPAGLEEYISANNWTDGCPVSGTYQWVYNNGLAAHTIVIDNGPSLDLMQLTDERVDDGNLAAGLFRHVSGLNYFYIVR